VADANGVLVDRDVSGAPLGAGLGNAPLTNFVTTLALQNVAFGGFNSPANDMAVLLITITVNYGGGQSVVLQAYRTRYAPEVR
jgi:MSHA pilin protein MshD